MHEWVLMTTPGTLPCSFRRVSIGRVHHLNDQVAMQVAGGGEGLMYLSPAAVEFMIRDPTSDVEYRWNGQVFFALGQQFVLLGQHHFLEKFDVLFKGKERALEMTPLFRQATAEGPARRR